MSFVHEETVLINVIHEKGDISHNNTYNYVLLRLICSNFISLAHSVRLFKSSEVDGIWIPVYVLESGIKYWKHVRFLQKTGSNGLRINVSHERKQFLDELLKIPDLYKPNKSAVNTNLASNINHLMGLSAYLYECNGKFQESLSVLSDLIAAQAIEGVDLSYVILKAALLLKHIGTTKFKQCLEYLDYLLEDPPVSEGITRTHILAAQLLVYEQGGEKYKVLLPKHYKDLADSYQNDIRELSGPGKKHVSVTVEGSEIWETLALQAMDKCEYVMAAEFAGQALLKAPNKPKLLHSLAEVRHARH